MTRKLTYLILILSLPFIMMCTKGVDKSKIEKFVWIQNNLNWISDTSELKAKKLIEYIDSTKEIHYAKSKFENSKLIKTEYFYDTLSDTLENLILSKLFGKSFPQTFDMIADMPMCYDGDFYCIIYKFVNEPERIINFASYNIPDSLKDLTRYLNKLTNRKTFKPYKKFDTERLLNKYKQIIFRDNPLSPPERVFVNKIK